MSLLEVSVWEPFGEKHPERVCVKPDVRVAERIHKKSAEYEERRYSEIGWYRDSHRPLFYDRRTVFFYFTGNSVPFNRKARFGKENRNEG